MATVQGVCESAFESVRLSLQNNIEIGEELGACIVLNIDGKNVIDIHGGYVDEERTKPWAHDTIVNVWSSTKTVLALAILVLHERGLLDVNENVAKYWPEFAANGKEDIKVRHILSHTSGVSGWDRPFNMTDIYDTKASTEKLAQQAPWWKPGTASGYHAINMGHLLGELVLRTSGKSLTQFVAEDLAGPLGADFQIGAKESDWSRISKVIPPPPLPFDFATLDQESVVVKTLDTGLDGALANTSGWRKAEIGAANGHGNARSLARLLSVISLGGTLDEHKFLSQATINMIFQEQMDGTDLVLFHPLRFGIGFGIAGGGTEVSVPFLPTGMDRKICFWGGWGGSLVVVDVDKRMTFVYVMNKMGAGTLGNPRTAQYIQAVYQALAEVYKSEPTALSEKSNI